MGLRLRATSPHGVLRLQVRGRSVGGPGEPLTSSAGAFPPAPRLGSGPGPGGWVQPQLIYDHQISGVSSNLPGKHPARSLSADADGLAQRPDAEGIPGCGPRPGKTGRVDDGSLRGP